MGLDRKDVYIKSDFYAEESENLTEENLRFAQELLSSDRKRALAMLNVIFRTGRLPGPNLDGFYAGEFLALDIAPGLTQLFELLGEIWMPWKGKTFNAAQEAGDNVITRNSRFLFRLFLPFYNYYVKSGPKTYRAFPFRTYSGAGRVDPDRQVLKLDYNLKINPRQNVRRVLDELVQIEDGLYLGKAHLKWWWGWRQVAFFILRKGSSVVPG